MDDNKIRKILRKCLLIKSRQNKNLKLFYLFKWNKNILDSKLYFINKSRNLKLNLNKINIYDKLYNEFKFRDSYISAMKIYNQLKEDSIYSFKPNINNNYYINTDNRSLNKSISYCSFKVSNSTKNIKKTDKNIINHYNYKNNHSNYSTYSTNNNIFINKKNKSNTKNNNKYFIDFVNNNLITNNNTKENLMKMLYSNYKNKNIFRKKSKPKIIKNKSISNYNEDSFNVYNNNFIDLNEKSSIKSNNNSFNKINYLNKEKNGFLSNRFKNKNQGDNNISIGTFIDPYSYIHNKNNNNKNNNNNMYLTNKNYQKNSKLIKKIKKGKKDKHSQNSINSNNDNNNSSYNINNTASLTNPNLFNSNNTNINNNNNNNVNLHNTSSTFNNTNANIKNNLLIYEKGELNNNNSLNISKNKKIINKSQTLQIDTLTSNDDDIYSKKHSFNNSIHNKYNNNNSNNNNKKLILTKNSLYLNANYPQISNVTLQSKSDEKMFMEAKNILSSDHSLQRYLEGYYKYKDKKNNNKN